MWNITRPHHLTVDNCTVLFCTILYLYCAKLYCICVCVRTALYNTVFMLYCAVLYLYYTVLYCSLYLWYRFHESWPRSSGGICSASVASWLTSYRADLKKVGNHGEELFHSNGLLAGSVHKSRWLTSVPAAPKRARSAYSNKWPTIDFNIRHSTTIFKCNNQTAEFMCVLPTIKKIYIHIKKPLFYDKRLMLNNFSLIDLQVVKVNVIHD